MTDDAEQVAALIKEVLVSDGQDPYVVWMDAQKARQEKIGEKIDAQIAARGDKKAKKR